MIILYQFRDAWDLQPSPFCLKMGTWLKMAGLPYQAKRTVALSKAPTGKLPYIVTDDGKTIGDSGLIVEYLKSTVGVTIDDGLSGEDLAVATAITRLVEEHLYFVSLYFRWVDDAGWAVVKPAFFGAMPMPLKTFIPAMLRRGVKRTLFAQGVGRHSPDQLAAMGRSDLNAIAVILGDKPFLLGDQPRTVDAAAYGLLANLAYPPVDSPLKQALLDSRPLVDYCDRVRDRFWSDSATG